jgi:NhaA family Na+:H+ antiporter
MTPAHKIQGRAVLATLEHALHPWVAFFVVPVFAFANAGVRLDWQALGDAFNRQVTWGIAIGLVIGKPIGVSLFTWLGLRLRLGALPPGIGMRHIAAMSPLTGIGFTVALVISALSFEGGSRLDAAKVGVLGGSLFAALLGLAALRFVTRRDTGTGSDSNAAG